MPTMQEDTKVGLREDDLVWSVAQLEARLYMGNTLLRDSDANGMAHSLEIRVPLLDRRLLDYALSIPGEARLPTGRADKHLLRHGFAEFLPPELTELKKRGFTLPIGHWMVGPLRELCESGIDHLRRSGLLRAKAVAEVWEGYLERQDRARWARAFALCVLGLYMRRIGL